MSGSWPSFDFWLLRSAAGGGLLLLVTWALMQTCRQPAWRQRLGEWGQAAALLMAVLVCAPAWLALPALPAEAPAQAEATLPPGAVPHDRTLAEADSPPSPPLLTVPGDAVVASAAIDLEAGANDPLATQPQAANALTAAHAGDLAQAVASSPVHKPVASEPFVPAQAESSHNLDVRPIVNWLGSAYLIIAWIFLCRWLLSHVALWRLLRGARRAPAEINLLFRTMARGRLSRPRLLVARRLKVPISCGLWRPTVIVPESLCASDARNMLRWVFAHELTHLERRDAWACQLAGLAQIVYFYVPWFWWLRRQVRLCQEYIADAAAARAARQPEDYAQFLLHFAAAPATPLAATGVFGNSSDLFRRVTMLVESRMRVQRSCPRWWSLATAGGLLALALLVSGVSLQGREVAAAGADVSVAFNPVPQKAATNPLPKKDEPAQREQAQQPGIGFQDRGQNLDPQQMQEQMQKMREETFRNLGQFQGQAFQRGGFGMAGFGHDGRLGVLVQKPNETLIEQLNLPKGEGLVVTSVTANSAAAKAGIKPHDILLEFNGKPVADEPSKLVHIIQDLKANTPIDAVVLRKGKKETVKGISLPEKQAGQPMFGGAGAGGFRFGGQGFGGAQAPPAPVVPRFGGENAFPGVQQAPAFGGRAGGNNTVITTNFRTGNQFITRHQEGSLIITATGTVDDGKSKVSQIKVQDGHESNTYEAVDKVPEQYRAKVKNLIETNEKSNTRIEIREPKDKEKEEPKEKEKDK
jgi:beta-lactamase regulating signal transducer with metallopeptidase domain/membrane-associated protease RseP (regulator of RpoE activity)